MLLCEVLCGCLSVMVGVRLLLVSSGCKVDENRLEMCCFCCVSMGMRGKVEVVEVLVW